MSKNKILSLAVTTVVALLAVGLWLNHTSAAVKQPQPTKPASSFAQRLAQRKDERQVKLAKEDVQRIRDRCIDGQTKVRSLVNRTTSIIDNHMRVYNRIDAKLWVMVGQIKLASLDTFKLETDRSIYVKKVAKFKITSGYYKQTLDDMVFIKCQADPYGFKALLETAKLYYKQIGGQVVDIRNYVVNTIKPILNSYSNQLQPKLDSTRQ